MRRGSTLFITFCLLLFFFAKIATVYAQSSTPTIASLNQTTPSAAIVNYNLAYPGILPDNPLYKLKVLRDKIIEVLIFDPMKKIDFYITQADKGILASAMLIDKNQVKLAQATALKAENNFTLIAPQLYRLFKKPKAEVFKRLETASLKHQEVLNSVIKRVPIEDQGVFEQVIDFSKRNLSTIKDFENQ